ncbi:unnamed protein product [Camellia sinensis]|uniref:uncharacterized protein C24B11.05 isoform X1 n=1 Tax=Camellia sinensis TaxID=4442 RepID=UPI001036498E|nr:uncharacterized protein C24B11.05 isoform X1 [Camellia sinensis]
MDSCSKSIRDSTSPFDCILFDLDDTLYPSKAGLGQATKRNIEDFLVEKCGFPETQASTLRVELFKTYGSTLAGLRALGYDIDADDYHSFVHGRLPYDSIKPDAPLRNLLRSINQRKIVFTNSDRNHAMKALDRLGIRDCFELIICFETLNPNLSKSTRLDEFPVVLKPSLDAIKTAIDVAEVDPCRTLFLDDSVRNVAAGKALGWKIREDQRSRLCIRDCKQLGSSNSRNMVWHRRRQRSKAQSNQGPVGCHSCYSTSSGLSKFQTATHLKKIFKKVLEFEYIMN